MRPAHSGPPAPRACASPPSPAPPRCPRKRAGPPPSSYDEPVTKRVVVELVAVEPVPLEEQGSRRAVVRWSDGTVSEALRWYDDEVLFSEGDLLGKTQTELRGLHHRRDREHLLRD